MTDHIVAGAGGTRRKLLSVGLGIIALADSTLLAISILWVPVWLAPPYTHNTIIVYLVLLILWPILVTVTPSIAFCMRWYSILVTVVVVIMLLITFLTWVGPQVTEVFGPLEYTVLECPAEMLSDTRLRYTCPAYHGEPITFESHPGLPIMWLVERNP